MTLGREIRQVLAELELISHGATVRFAPATSRGGAGSSVPSGESNPPHLRFRERFESCRTDNDRAAALEAAQAELRSLKCRTEPITGVDGAELLRRQVLEDFPGVSAVEVSIRLYCTTSKVRNIRMAAGVDLETGLDLVVLDHAEVARLLAAGMTEKQIAFNIGSTVRALRRMLDRAA